MLAISGSNSFVFLKRITDVREITRKSRATNPQDRVLLLYVNGYLLKREGRSQAAESQLTGTLSALADAGKQSSADGGAILGVLATVYLQEHRCREAAAVLSTALATPSLSSNMAFLVRISLLNTRALVWGPETVAGCGIGFGRGGRTVSSAAADGFSRARADSRKLFIRAPEDASQTGAIA